jgi:hypothetical protein
LLPTNKVSQIYGFQIKTSELYFKNNSDKEEKVQVPVGQKDTLSFSLPDRAKYPCGDIQVIHGKSRNILINGSSDFVVHKSDYFLFMNE